MYESILSTIIQNDSTSFKDIIGLEKVADLIRENVIWVIKNPELFSSDLLKPPKGVLLFGPPGNGKTLIGKAIAAECGATFFSISASTLTSKWVGEGEKMVKMLFAVAREHAPAVIFIDEIDAVFGARSEKEEEHSRRLKNEFMVQTDGVFSECDSRAFVLLVGATNRPQEIDDALRRRLEKRI